MRNSMARRICTFLVLLCGVSSAALAAPQTGWWWNPNESGRGFFVESHDGITFIGAYLYDNDGHALWLVAGGANDDSYNYTGPLYSQAGGQSLFGNYVVPAAPVSVGQITVHFADDTHGTVTWPGGVVQIERDVFGTGDAPFQPDNGWWWNPDESGSGYSLEVQGGNLFVVGFMYESSGRPVWYFSAGPMASATTYHGDVMQFANGQTMGGAYRLPDAPVKIATLDIEFTAENEAATTFTDLSGTAMSGLRAKAGRSNHWQPQFPKPGRFQFPDAYVGGFSFDSVLSNPAGTVHWTFVGTSFSLNPTGPVPGGTGSRDYAQTGGTMQLSLSGTIADCTESGTFNVDLPPGSITLRVSTFSLYTVTLNLSAAVVNGRITCPGPPATQVPVPVPWPGATDKFTHAVNNLDLNGRYQRGSITQKWHENPGPGSTVDGFVNLVAVYGL
jgi:hypothetical protein